ncbi:hypothetical protein [Jeotgalicoccus sp. WY2]|nr:hypothetical protein [Jeotgalicoccus sp. WY2]
MKKEHKKAPFADGARNVHLEKLCTSIVHVHELKDNMEGENIE